MSITQTATKKIAITERALYQRISRRLRRDGQQLRTNRSERWFRDLGLYYTAICTGTPSRLRTWTLKRWAVNLALSARGKK